MKNPTKRNGRVIYSPEIDGLRSVAVLVVILYHFGVPGFSGGFVGVDIFFVISGFLISRLLLEELKEGRFKFSVFFVRRARRLFPALFVILLSTFCVGFVLFSAEDMERLSGSIVYASMSLSNIFFWLESDYFDAASELKPLLHTWSLSVEEQFYLFWPVLLYFLHKVPRSWPLPVMVICLGIVSLLGAEVVLKEFSPASFYLTPFRIFEFAIGAGVIWVVNYFPGSQVGKVASSILGVALIIYSVHFFNGETPFPGVNALFPCVGAALLIYAGGTGPVGRVLASAGPVGIGKISYSLYLTHWPIFVFYKYLQIEPLGVIDQIALLGGTLVSALALYNFIEKPFRFGMKGSAQSSPAAFGLACAILTLALVLPAADSWANKGWVWRFKENEMFLTRYDINDKSYVWDLWKVVSSNSGLRSAKAKIYLIGDSQAADMLNAISTTKLVSGINSSVSVSHIQYFCGGVFIPSASKESYYGVENKAFLKEKVKREICEGQNSSAFSVDMLKGSEIVVLGPFWYDYLVQYLPGTIDRIREGSSAKIIVVGHKHMLASSTGIFRYHKSLYGIEAAAAKFIDPDTVAINNRLEKISKEKGVLFFNPLKYLCAGDSGCKVVGRLGGPMMYDTHHLTPEGAEFMGGSFAQWVKENNAFN